MLLSDLSIKRPVFATVMILALLVLGIFSFRWLSIDMWPNVEIPFVTVNTPYPGAAPESVELEVSKRIESSVNAISGVKHVYSYSKEGISTVVIEFRLEEKLNEVVQEVRARVHAVRGQLPRGIEEPIIQKYDVSGMPIVSLALQSDRLSPRDLTILAEKKVKRRFESIAGIGKVDLVGAVKREVHVTVDPAKAEAFGLGVDELIAGLRAENLNTPLGRLTRGETEHPLRIVGKPEQAEQLRSFVIAERNGRPLRLSEVADVTDGTEERRSLALVNGKPAVALDLMKQSGSNTVEVADAVKKTMNTLRGELPPGTTLSLVRDGSLSIRESVTDVLQTLILGGILTVLIVFCFINSWRSTVITGVTLPISVIASFAVMYFLGMTLNMMTLMALSLSIGLLIDDAIVVRENIVRRLEQGEEHMEAARQGTSEIGLAVLATTFSIVAVFIPVAFMKGHVGRFFYQFGLTVAFAVLVSLFVSFTLDPMLSSRWHDPAIAARGRRRGLARLLDRFNDAFDRTADRYQGSIAWSLRHRFFVLTAAVIAFAGGLLLFTRIESAFMPNNDRGEFQVQFKAAPDASLQESEERLQAMLRTLSGMPEIANTYGAIGAGDEGTVRRGYLYIKLVPKRERNQDQFQIQEDCRRRFRTIPGVVTSVEIISDHGGWGKPLCVNVRGPDIDRLKAYSRQIKEIVQTIPGIVDLEATMEEDIPEYRILVDRERASDAGMRTAEIARHLNALVGGEVVSTYEDEDGDAVDIRVRLPETLRQDPSQLARLRLTAFRGQGVPPAMIPLGNLASYAAQASPAQINRQDLERQVSITANLEGIPLGTALEKVEKATRGMALEPGYRITFTGEAEDMADSFRYLVEALIMAILFVYLILAAQFESFLEPLAIMLSLPLAVVGMAGMLFLTGDTISIISLIGLILLMGLVTKNAILLVDYAKVLQRRGMDRNSAVMTAGRTRLRPILMTTLAMIFGMIPLAFAVGAGAEARAPMGRAVIGGLITSTMLTLFVVPVAYTVLDDLRARVNRRRAKKEEKETEHDYPV
jgi:HAE1 family hydrophobic/amphiphilic exporter-1